MASADIDEFMHSPLVIWLQSCLDNPDRLQDYSDLIDGTLIGHVLLSIDPDPLNYAIEASIRNAFIRIRNMCYILKNIKVLYEEEFCQLVVMLPDCLRLGKEPESKEGVDDMKLLLLLLLGCAVQCPNKHRFIEGIKELPLEHQHTLVCYIQQVTESQEIVLTSENCDKLTTNLLITHVRRLVKERDYYFQMWLSLFEETQSNANNNYSASSTVGNAMESQSQHLAVELADWKAKLRKLRQELEEKSEALVETKEELERGNGVISKLRSEMQELKQEARAGKVYRDEVDALRERAERCDRLESEVGKYREKLGDLEYYKSRVEELRQDNRVLEETREMLEEQLSKSRKRAEYALQLESDIVRHKQIIDEITLERDANQEKLQELIEENTQFRLSNKHCQSTNATLNTNNSNDSLIASNNLGCNDNSLSEQLNTSVHTRALKLELENKKLLSTIENLQDSSFYRENQRILELEKEKKKLSLQVEDIQETKKRFAQNINNLESSLQDIRSHVKRLQDSNQLLQNQLEMKQDEMETINKDKRKLEDKMLEMSREIDSIKEHSEEKNEIRDEAQNKIAGCEKEITKLKNSIEEQETLIDKLTADCENYVQEKELSNKQLNDANSQLSRLYELEKEIQDLLSQREIDVATLTALKQDLVAEKLKSEQLKNSLDTLGLPIDNCLEPDKVFDRSPDRRVLMGEVYLEKLKSEQLKNSLDTLGLTINNCLEPNKVFDRIVSNPEVLRAARERLSKEQANVVNEACAVSNAKLQVNITTLQSQITSLASQHTALQLANSQLVAEKEEAIKELNELQSNHQRLLNDQRALQQLHEQLTSEYESIIKERETLKMALRDLKTEKRNLFEQYNQIEVSYNTLLSEKENYVKESKSLTNLRVEHSKLKEDFRTLFAASEKMKLEYRSLQEEYNNIRSEAARLKLTVTDLRGKLATNNERISGLNLEVVDLNNKYELLSQVKHNLEEDRRSLMEHVTILLSQYHELLTHSLEDKEHYHMEEKMFADKVNNLCRQKEKLEEKLIQQYGKMDSCSYKKKGFGARIVRRMKKAGSELINKNRRSLHEESVDRRNTDSDTSAEDNARSKEASLDMDDNLSCLSVPGTRRTVYLSGNENVDADNISTSSTNDLDETLKSTASDQIKTSTPHQDQRTPLLVYNRVSANLGGRSSRPQSPTNPPRGNEEVTSSTTRRSENPPIWHEYGCV